MKKWREKEKNETVEKKGERKERKKRGKEN